MEVTSVKIQKLFEGSKTMLTGIASVIIDNMICINDIRILKSADKVFVAMPNKMISEGLYKDIVHPINKEGRAVIEEAVLSAYAAYLEEKEAAKKPEEATAESVEASK